MPTIAEQRARIAELASRMIAKNPGNAGAIMQQLKDAGLDISGNPIGAQAPAATPFGGRPPTPPPTGFPPAPGLGGGLTGADQAIPFGGTGGYPNSLRSMADRGDPNQAPDFRSRLTDARMMQGSATPTPGMAVADPSMANVAGQLPGNFMSPGNLPRPRPFESMIAARPEGPPGGFPAAPPPLQQLSSAGPPSPLTGMGRPSPLAQAGGPSSLSGVGPPAPIIGREAPPGLNGPPSPLASRFGDQSQLPGGAFSGSLPRPPQPRPFESTIAARPMPPGGPGSLPAAPVLAGQPFTGSPGMASRFGDQSQLASGAFSGGPPPPLANAGGPPPPTPQQLDAAKDMVRQMASLPQVAPPRSLQPIETTPTSTMSNPLQRAPLNLAAGAGASALPLGSTSLPFAGIPPTPASVNQRTADVLGPVPPGAGTGAPVRSVQQPLIGVPPATGTVPPIEPVPSQDLPPPVSVPSMLASVGPPNPARMEVVANYNPQTGQRIAATPRGKGARQATAAAAPPPAVPAQQQQKPFLNAPNIGTGIGAIAGLVAGGPGGAVTGAAGGRVLGKVISAIRNRGHDVDAKGNIIDKAGNIIGHISDKMGGIFGNSGSSVSGGNWTGRGGSQYGGGFGGGGGYGGGGTYGGSGGAGINQGIGGAFRNR